MFSLFKKNRPHAWRTVLIDTSEGCSVATPGENENIRHILLYQICNNCGVRQFKYDDPREVTQQFAKNKNSEVALKRTKWIEAGIIDAASNLEYMTFIDPSYAPLRGFEEWAKAFATDPEMCALVKNHSMVDDALGQLEVAVKLCIDNEAV
jgi:hypothetical protein